MKKLCPILTVISCVLVGCDIKEPPECVQGMEKCEIDESGMGTGIYQACTSDGEWGGRFICGAGCSSQNQCTKNSKIPVCENEGEIKCFNDLNIAFKCLNQTWIPQMCEVGCSDESGCLVENHSCSSSEDNCLDIDGMGSVLTKCRDNAWTLSYCPKNIKCDGKECEDSEILSCGESAINCKVDIDGWKSGKCDEGECLVLECMTGYHIVDEERNNIFCELNTKDNCGSHGNPCPEDKACQQDTGKCGCTGDKQACDGSCVDIKNNTEHCGGCNRPCEIEHSDEVTCDNGSCKAVTCEYGFDVSEDGKSCEKSTTNDITACGETSINCTTAILGWFEGECREGMCVVSKCIGNMHPYTTAEYSICEVNDMDNCGEHGDACLAASVLNSRKVACSESGQCEATECANGYHVFGGECEKDDNTNCGEHGKGCNIADFDHSSGVACQKSENSDKFICAVTGCEPSSFLNADGDKCITCSELVKDVQKGDSIYFGHYQQLHGDDTKYPIEWKVLDADDDGVTVISRHVLDGVKYNETFTAVTWETSTLRSWLNGLGKEANLNGVDYTDNNFIKTAFNDEELKCIQEVTNENPNNQYYNTNGGNETSDKVFLLSLCEAGYNPPSDKTQCPADGKVYFSSDNERLAYATLYAEEDKNVYTYTSYSIDDVSKYYTNVHHSAHWWLRSPGYYADYAAFVYYDGYVYDGGNDVSNTGPGVRPALCLNR